MGGSGAETDIDPFEACLEVVVAFAGSDLAPLLWTAASWRRAALRGSRRLRVLSKAPRQVILDALRSRPFLRCIDFCSCEAMNSDAALAELVDIFRRRSVQLDSLRLTGTTALGVRSRQSLRRLGLTCWAFPTSQVEQGCVLLSRPNFVAQESQPHLVRSVVLVVRRDAGGILGLALNKPTVLEMARLSAESPTAPWSPQLDECPVFCGGDQGRELTLLHGNKELGGTELVDGVFLARCDREFARAADFVRWGKMRPEDCRWLLGSCHWSRDELRHELALGMWQPAHCDNRYLLPHSGSFDDLWSDLHTLTS